MLRLPGITHSFPRVAPALLAGAALIGPLTTGSASAPPLPPKVAPNKLSAVQALATLQADRDRYWLNARKEVYKSTLELIGQHQAELQRGLRFSKLMRGNPRKNQIALTFDDGPHPDYTPRILAILQHYKIPATFFLVGEQAEKYPNLVRAERAGGHSIGNHTYHHVSLIKIPEGDVVAEIKTCGQILRSITGRAPRLFRPPGGEYNTEVAEASEALGYAMILWTDDPGDYASPGRQVILTRTLDKAASGGIILIHDGIEQTIAVLPQIIETLQKRGFTFVTVDEMLPSFRKLNHTAAAGGAVRSAELFAPLAR